MSTYRASAVKLILEGDGQRALEAALYPLLRGAWYSVLADELEKIQGGSFEHFDWNTEENNARFLAEGRDLDLAMVRAELVLTRTARRSYWPPTRTMRPPPWEDQSCRAIHDLGAAEARVDLVGIGGGVVDRLEEQREPVVGLNAGSAARDSERFANARAEWCWGLRDRFERREIAIYSSGRIPARCMSADRSHHTIRVAPAHFVHGASVAFDGKRHRSYLRKCALVGAGVPRLQGCAAGT